MKLEEVLRAVNIFENGKSAQTDKINPEMIKYLGLEGLNVLHILVLNQNNTRQLYGSHNCAGL